MGYGVRLRVWGDYACFTRPEIKTSRVSYDVMTPAAARGILEAIHWKPAIRWHVRSIHVLHEIRFEMTYDYDRVREQQSQPPVRFVQNPKRIQALAEQEKQQAVRQTATATETKKHAVLLRKPHYIIDAHFDMTPMAGSEDSPEKHYNIFLRRARQGQCFHRPYFGSREFPVQFALMEPDTPYPADAFYANAGTQDLGWLLHDLDFDNGMTPRFFRATMRDGVIDIPHFSHSV